MLFLVILLFLGSTLWVSHRFHKQETTFQEYAIGKQYLRTPVVVATVLATTFGGNTLWQAVEKVPHLGLPWTIGFLVGSFLMLGILSDVVARRILLFKDHLSMAETIGSVYGQYPRILAALAGIGTSIAILVAQINCMDYAMQLCFHGADATWITILATCVVLIYTTFGGMQSITHTDCLQFAAFLFLIPCLSFVLFVKTNTTLHTVFALVQSQPKLQFHSIYSSKTGLINMFCLFCSTMLSHMQPGTMQRIHLVLNERNAKNMFHYTRSWGLLLNMLVVLMGLCVFVKAPDLPMSQVWPYVASTIPSFFKGFIALGLLATAMSTADSNLHACAVLISHDVLGNIQPAKATSDAHRIKWAKMASLTTGTLAMVLALYRIDVLDLLKGTFACSVPLAAAPFLLAIYGFQGTSRTALIGMGTGVASMAAWTYWIEPTTGINGIFPCTMANGCAMMIAHYAWKQPQSAGWMGMHPDYEQMKMAEERAFFRAKKRAVQFFKIWNPAVLARSVPPTSQLIGVCFYCVSVTVFSAVLNRGNSPVLEGWYLQQLIAGLLFGFAAFLRNGRNEQTQTKYAPFKGFLWVGWLTYCLLINAVWHWEHAVLPGFALCLTFAHVGVMFFLTPYYAAWHLVTVVFFLAFSRLMLLGKGTCDFSFEQWVAIGVGIVAFYLLDRHKKEGLIQQSIAARKASEDAFRRRQKEIRYIHNRALDPSASDHSQTLQVLAGYRVREMSNQ